MAADQRLDLGAFLYAVRRLPDGIIGAELVLLGQDHDVFAASGIDLSGWREAEAVARRRHWFDSTTGLLAVLLASTSDVDDLVPTLVAFQIEWNKLNAVLRTSGVSEPLAGAAECAEALGGEPADWLRLRRPGAAASLSGCKSSLPGGSICGSACSAARTPATPD